MNKRIEFLAKQLKNQNIVIDIGADHCYLALYLLKNNLVNKVINIDINKEPLLNGQKNIPEVLLPNTEFILNDGLKNLNIKSSAICIAGMGGAKIIEIIKNNHNHPDNFYLIQANNSITKLREYLKNNKGFVIDEFVFEENKIIYEIIKFKFSKKTNIKTKKDLYIGPKLKKDKKNILLLKYIKSKIQKFNSFLNNNTNKSKKKEYNILLKFLKRSQKKYED